MGVLRRLYHRALLVPVVDSCFRLARRDCSTVLMCHRFMDRDRGIAGLDPALLRRGLEYLRKHRYELLSLTELFRRLRAGTEPLGGAVVFTIDDGYIDASVAAPIFAEFDCPVTTFITTGFVDGSLWMWWDKIEHVFSTCPRDRIEVTVGTDALVYDCSSPDARAIASDQFVRRCKPLKHDEKLTVISRLADMAQVDLPSAPPERYRPMAWDDARHCEARGMSFGPHTVTHPILTTVEPRISRWEITESWRRLSSEVRQPVPVFCYPNGQWADFDDEVVAVLRTAAFQGAVVGEWGFVDRASFQRTADAPFKTKRLPYPASLSDLVQYVCGIERCKEYVRSRL